jgi:hypothetical protein
MTQLVGNTEVYGRGVVELALEEAGQAPGAGKADGDSGQGELQAVQDDLLQDVSRSSTWGIDRPLLTKWHAQCRRVCKLNQRSRPECVPC